MEKVIEIAIAGKENLAKVKYEAMELPVVYYLTEGIESIEKADLVVLKMLVGSECLQLRTNAGVDLHSSEGNIYKGVEVIKVPYLEMQKELKKL